MSQGPVMQSDVCCSDRDLNGSGEWPAAARLVRSSLIRVPGTSRSGLSSSCPVALANNGESSVPASLSVAETPHGVAARVTGSAFTTEACFGSRRCVSVLASENGLHRRYRYHRGL